MRLSWACSLKRQLAVSLRVKSDSAAPICWTRNLCPSELRFPRRNLHSPSRPPDPASLPQWKDCVEAVLRNPELSEEEAKLECRWMYNDCCQDIPAGTPQAEKWVEHCERRGTGEPLQYIEGITEFGPLSLRSRPPIFIPRPETAYVFERLSSLLSGSEFQTSRILDIATGSGSIPLLLAHLNRSLEEVVGIDINPFAVALAKENVESLGLNNRVVFKEGDIFNSKLDLGKRFTIVVSNPPYIPLEEWRDLSSSVKDFEDPRALIGDPTDWPEEYRKSISNATAGDSQENDGKGLTYYRHIAKLLPELLTEEVKTLTDRKIPIVAVEIGACQAEDVVAIFEELSSGLVERTEVWQDQYGRDRMVVGW